MEISEGKTREHVLEVLKKEGYVDIRERGSEMFEVEHPKKRLIIVLYLNEKGLVIAFNSKVTHSDYSEPELQEVECYIQEKIAA